MMGTAPAKPRNAPLPKGKAPAFVKWRLFPPPAFPKAGDQHLSGPVESHQLQALQHSSSQGSHLIRKNSNHLHSHWLCANGKWQNTFLFYLKGFWSQCEALDPSAELPTRPPALPVPAQKSFSHQKGSPAPPLHNPSQALLCSLHREMVGSIRHSLLCLLISPKSNPSLKSLQVLKDN